MKAVDRLPAHWPYDVSRRDAARVLEAVGGWLCIHVDQTARRLGMGLRLVADCLDVLQEARLLPRPGQSVVPSSVSPERRRWLEVRLDSREAQSFSVVVPPEQRRWLEALRGNDASVLLHVVRKRGEARIQELAGELGMSRKVVRRYLRTLCDAGLLRRSSHYHPVYSPADPDRTAQEGTMRRGSEARNRLMEAVRAQPGINKMALCERTGLGWGTVFRHIKLLEGRGVLEVRRDGREARMYPARPPGPWRWSPSLRPGESAAALRLRSRDAGLPRVQPDAPGRDAAHNLDPDGPVVQGILSTIGRRPGITREGLQNATGFSRAVVEAAIGWLVLRGLVVRRGAGFWPRGDDPPAPSLDPDFDPSAP